MAKPTVLGILLCLLFLAATTGSADSITSCLGHQGPAFAPGTTPGKLGWGPNDKPYPDKFVVNPGDGSEMVWVPPGEFMMGSTAADAASALEKLGADARWLQNEHPAHKVRITKGFWLGKCTVTNAQYRAFCQATGAPFPELSKNGPKHPVVWVSWDEAKAYCDHYGLVLPTEAQWEYAARGPEGRSYPWGNDWDPRKCCNAANKGPGALGTMEVGTLPAGDSWCGASDMAGNVWQWCADWYGEGYYAKSPEADPPGWVIGTSRLVRGGAWDDSPIVCRSAFRIWSLPVGRCSLYGFRCARTP